MKKIAFVFFTLLSVAILGCWLLIGIAIYKSRNLGDDDTLGLFVWGFLFISLYIIVFWIINLGMIDETNTNYRFYIVKLIAIFLFCIAPVTAGLIWIL